MGFPRSLTTGEMTLYVMDNFKWYCREVVFSPKPLSYDYEELCLNFDFVVAEEHAQIYELPILPQVVFLAMLLNDAVNLGVLSGRMIAVMESVLTELQWNGFQPWTGRNSGRIMEGRRQQETSSDSYEEESSGSDGQTPRPVMIARDEARLVVTVPCTSPPRDED
ncbi:hypothetical protein Cgig2_007474 [Carnegiea gigantea]|uniref:Uncharacterized protein n=1 Tax=Carnegiea gigantea TaxID=171969 RepID=A0A9Q1K6E8_9CARY|nr:hypothetical protein Cgig2_007474 [Carnegiea gigantea]